MLRKSYIFLLAVAVLGLSACVRNVRDEGAIAPQYSYVNFANGVPSTNLYAVIGGFRLTATPVAFGQASFGSGINGSRGHIAVAAGTRPLSIQVAPTATTPGASLFAQNINLEAGRRYSMFALPTAVPIVLDGWVIEDQLPTTSATDTVAHFRFAHAAFTGAATPVDLVCTPRTITNNAVANIPGAVTTTLFTNVSYRSATAFVTLPVTSNTPVYRFEIRAAGTTTVLASFETPTAVSGGRRTTNLRAARVYTVAAMTGAAAPSLQLLTTQE